MLLMDHLLYRTSVFGRKWNGDKSGKDVFKIGPVTNMSPPEIVLEEKASENPAKVDV